MLQDYSRQNALHMTFKQQRKEGAQPCVFLDVCTGKRGGINVGDHLLVVPLEAE